MGRMSEYVERQSESDKYEKITSFKNDLKSNPLWFEDEEFLKRQKLINRICIRNDISRGFHEEGYFTHFDSMKIDFMLYTIEALNRIYPGNYDINGSFIAVNVNGIDYYMLYTMKIKILFPEIEIKNSKDRTHIIRDIVVRFGITSQDGYYTFNDIMGTRLTVTEAEYDSNYMHSHLPGLDMKNYPTKYKSFCLGEGEINQTMILLGSGEDRTLVDMFLMQIPEYLKWESLEGNPHRTMDSINKSGNNVIANCYNDSKEIFYKALLNFYRVKKDLGFEIPKVDFRFLPEGTGLAEILDNDNLDAYIKFRGNTIENYICAKDRVHQLFVRKDHNGDFVRIKDSAASARFSAGNFEFRGVHIPFNVIFLDNNENEEYFIHPQVKKYVYDKLTTRLQDNQIRRTMVRA